MIGEGPLHSQSTSLAKVAPLPGLAMRFLQEIGDGHTGTPITIDQTDPKRLGEEQEWTGRT
ncbi:hypothetical protein GCM10011571_13790 [Marinithermofilum abyssi]|uniref:Uncharacterized protein n=1 Tax=Marinithermofilum abyssi TaxID=1571185 RepID=A0A8J2VEW4_9BACL|nr:hypothetical protein GCM10011571_13790 [Marinithermofilum abyssi]